MRLTVAHAASALAAGFLYSFVRQGLLTRNGAGGYSDVSATPAAVGGASSPEAAEQTGAAETAEDAPLAFAPAEEAALSEFASQLDPSIQLSIVEQITSGGIEKLDMTQAASSGMDAGHFRESISATVEMFTKQANAHCAAKGVAHAEFYEWARSNEPAEIQRLMREHALRRSPTVYDALIEKFTRSTVPSAEALSRGGINTSTARGVGGAAGTDMVTINGLTMTAKVASRIGLI